MSQYLSPNFTLDELTFSGTAVRNGIDNTPTPDALLRLSNLAVNLEKIRSALGYPLHINSGYRCPALNALISKAKHSAHLDGDAADFTSPRFGTPSQIVRLIVNSGIKFDQCIEEGTWVHVSFAPAMRQQILTAHFDANGVATYTNGLA